MSTIERLAPPISKCLTVGVGAEPLGNPKDATAFRPRAARSSFFWAMQLLSHRRRQAMYALYAFCREVDDIADGDAPRAVKDILLSDWRREIAFLYAGHPRHAVARGLSEAIHRYGLKCEDFLAIIDGMELDVRTDIRAPSLAMLDLYCERALQLTNILRDLAEDARRNRLYLPCELLHAHGVFATTPIWVLAQPALREVCRDVAMLAEKHYSTAAEAIAACPPASSRSGSDPQPGCQTAIRLGTPRAIAPLPSMRWTSLSSIRGSCSPIGGEQKDPLALMNHR